MVQKKPGARMSLGNVTPIIEPQDAGRARSSHHERRSNGGKSALSSTDSNEPTLPELFPFWNRNLTPVLGSHSRTDAGFRDLAPVILKVIKSATRFELGR